MSGESFGEHLAYLGQLERLDVALLYKTLADRDPWPRYENVALDPLAVIVFGVGQLVERLAPDSGVMEHPEIGAISQAVGLILHWLSQVEMVASVAALPPMIGKGGNEGAQKVGTRIAQILTLDYGESGLAAHTEEVEDGEVETAESSD